MNTYLTAWLVAVAVSMIIGLVIGLWSTFRKDGKTYTRRNLFGLRAWCDFGVVVSILVALAVCWSSSALLSDFWTWSSTEGIFGALLRVGAALAFTGAVAFIGLIGAFYCGHAVAQIIVALQIRYEEQRAEIAAGVTAKLSELDAAADNKKVIRFSDATQASNQ